jgi:hypothetical protein
LSIEQDAQAGGGLRLRLEDEMQVTGVEPVRDAAVRFVIHCLFGPQRPTPDEGPVVDVEA